MRTRRPRRTWRFGGGGEHEGNRTGVQIGLDTVRGLREEDDGVAVRFRMTDMGRPAEEVPLVPVRHTCGESARRIRMRVHELPADRVWYLVLIQAYLEQGTAKGDRAWCHGVVVTNGWKARADNKWAVYRNVKEIRVDERVSYGSHRHTPSSHQKPHRGWRAHLHGGNGLHPQRKPLGTPRSPPPRPHRQAATPTTTRATSQAPEEDKGTATAPRARDRDPQRTRDHDTGPHEGQPHGHLPDSPARAAQPDPHSTDPASHPHLTAPPSHQPATLRPALRTTTRARLTSNDPPRHNTRHHGTPHHSAPQNNTTRQGTAKHSTPQHDATRRGTERHTGARHGTPRRSPAGRTATQHGPTRRSTSEHGTTQHGAPQRTTTQSKGR